MEENFDQFLQRFFETHRGDRIIEEAKKILKGTAWQGYTKKITTLYTGLYCLSLNQISVDKIKDLNSDNLNYSELDIHIYDSDGNARPLNSRSELDDYVTKCHKATELCQIIGSLFELYNMHKDCVDKFEAYNSKLEKSSEELKSKCR